METNQELEKYKKDLFLNKYEEIQQKNVELMRVLLDSTVWNMLYAFYTDPDSEAIKKSGDIECTADGLLSIRRIYKKNGMSETTVEEYDRYRRVPIFFFPRERNGINMTRASVFGDRIDHTLFDLKNYYNNGNAEDCRLHSAYGLCKTKKWLQEIGSFDNLVEWYGIKGSFVNDKYEVFDLEKGHGSIITGYQDTYPREWSDNYYNNLKAAINEFYDKHEIKF